MVDDILLMMMVLLLLMNFFYYDDGSYFYYYCDAAVIISYMVLTFGTIIGIISSLHAGSFSLMDTFFFS